MSNLYTLINQEAQKQRQQVQNSVIAEPDPNKVELDIESPTLSETKVKDKGSTKPNDRTDQPNGSAERLDDSTKTLKGETKAKPSKIKSAEEPTSLIEEMKQGGEPEQRPTERYSFEIYTDQKEKILEIKYQYEKQTGKRLSKSRIIREALDVYFQKALNEST